MSAGERIGEEIRVNTTTASYQTDPSVTALKDGGWVVTWVSDGQNYAKGEVYQQRYDAQGAVVGTETRVNTVISTSSDQIYPSITALDDGGAIKYLPGATPSKTKRPSASAFVVRLYSSYSAGVFSTLAPPHFCLDVP